MPLKKKERFEILLEDVQDEIQLLAEGQKMQGESLRAEMKAGFKDQNLQRELANKALIKRIDDTAASLRQGIQEVQGEVKGVKEEVRELRSDILPRLDGHESRISALEGKPAA